MAKMLILFVVSIHITHIDGKCISDTFFLPCRVYSDYRININGKKYTKYRIQAVTTIKGQMQFMIKEKK